MKKLLSRLFIIFAASCPLHAALNSTQPKPLPDFSKQAAGVNQQLVSFFQETQKTYEEGMQELDPTKVDGALHLLQMTQETKLFEVANLAINQSSSMKEKVAMQKIRSYQEAQETCNKKVDDLQKEIPVPGLLPEIDSEVERKHYYQTLGKQLTFIKKMDGSEHTPQSDRSEKVIGTLKNQVKKKTYEISKKIKHGDWKVEASNKTLEHKTLPQINAHGLALTSISKYLDIDEIKVDTQLLEVKQEVSNKVTTILDADETDQPAALAQALIVAKMVGSNLENQQEELDGQIDRRLKAFEKKNEKNTGLLAVLGNELSKDETGTGSYIIQDYPTLEACKVEAFRKKMQAFGVDHILTEFRKKNPATNETHTNLLRKHYDKFREMYESLVLDGLANPGGGQKRLL